MKIPANWMTTLGGLLIGIPALLAQAGIVIPDAVLTFIPSIGALLLGIGAKDSNVTGGTKTNSKVT